MKVKVNKKLFKIIVALIIIIAIVLIVAGIVMPMIRFNKLKSNLSKIDAEELKTKLIKEIEKTPLYIEDSTTITDGIKVNNLEDYVIASVMALEDDEIYYLSVPLFKIDSDSNGNFEGIEYVSNYYLGTTRIDIEQIIFNVLSNEFNIKNINYKDQTKLTEHGKNSVEIGSGSDKALVWYANEVCPNGRYKDFNSESDIMISAYADEIRQDVSVKTEYFGIDI